MISNLRACLLLFLLGFVACAPQPSASTPDAADQHYPVELEGHSIQLQLALSSPEQTKGLMFRDSLATDHGMLFIFKEPSQRSFWMRNTRIPLDLGYFDASGKLLEIHALYPYDENGVPSASTKVLMALEMNQGWFARHNIQPGAQLDLEAIFQGITARGAPVGNFAFTPSSKQ